MEDIVIKCVEKSCGKDFIFPVNEQKYYEKHGFQLPKRCKACREKRKREKRELERQDNGMANKDKQWGKCESCGQEQPLTEVGMCGPCTFGEADTVNGNW